MKGLEGIARMQSFNDFVGKAKSFGFVGSTSALWVAWKMEVWPKMEESSK